MKSLVAAVLLLAGSIAFAWQEAPQSKLKPHPVQKIDFESDTIEAKGEGPGICIIGDRGGTKFKSLIKVRESFSDRMMRSASEM